MHLKGGVDKLDLSEVRGCAVVVLTPTSRMGSVPCATLVQEREQARQDQRDQNFHVVAVISCVQRSPPRFWRKPLRQISRIKQKGDRPLRVRSAERQLTTNFCFGSRSPKPAIP